MRPGGHAGELLLALFRLRAPPLFGLGRLGHELAAVGLGGQPLLVLLAHLALVALSDGAVFEGAALQLVRLVAVEERLPWLVAACRHQR